MSSEKASMSAPRALHCYRAVVRCRKTLTGETIDAEVTAGHPLYERINPKTVDDLIHYLHFELGENNWSCDCNRCWFFGLDEPEQDPDGCREIEYAIEWFEVDGKRFVAKDEYGLEFEESQ